MGRKAFTLVELLVVIAIISLLISILAPSLNVAKDIAKQVVCSSNMNSTVKGLLLYGENNDDKYPPYRSLWVGGKPKAYPFPCVENTMWAAKVGDVDALTLQPRYRGAAMAFASGFVENPTYFYCPAQTHTWFRLDQYVYNTNVFPPVSKKWGTWDNSSSMVRMGYWFNTWGNMAATPDGPDIMFKTFSSIEGDKALAIDQPVFPWSMAVHTAKGKDYPTLNIAFADGHVEPKTSPRLMDMLLLNWGDALKKWEQAGANNDWHDAYNILNQEL